MSDQQSSSDISWASSSSSTSTKKVATDDEKMEAILKRLINPTYDATIQEMKVEAKTEGERKRAKAFENCSIEGRKTAKRYKELKRNYGYLEVRLELAEDALKQMEENAEQESELWKKKYDEEKDAKRKALIQNFQEIAESVAFKSPQWMIPLNICNSIRKSHGDSEELFICSFLTELFPSGEIILPLEKLNKKKIEEAYAVLSHYFYKTINKESLVENALKKLRHNARDKYYQMVAKDGIMGISANGDSFFYSVDPNGVYLPFKDAAKCQPMKSASIQKSYSIPVGFEVAEYLIIIHISPMIGIQHHRLDPGSGYLELNIYKHAYPKSKTDGSQT